MPFQSDGQGSGWSWYWTQSMYISRGHPEYANAEQIRNFSGFSQFLVQCTKMSLPVGGGGYVYAF